MVERLECMLAASAAKNKPRSFVLVVPDWRSDLARGLVGDVAGGGVAGECGAGGAGGAGGGAEDGAGGAGGVGSGDGGDEGGIDEGLGRLSMEGPPVSPSISPSGSPSVVAEASPFWERAEASEWLSRYEYVIHGRCARLFVACGFNALKLHTETGKLHTDLHESYHSH